MTAADPDRSSLLAERTWPAVGSPLVVVPTGSTEQHGPHLPLDTDSRTATAVASGLVDALREAEIDALLAPTVAVGASGEHDGFAGTLSIGTDALASVLIELARSVRAWSAGVLFVNGHAGNAQALVRAVPQLLVEGHRAAWVPVLVPDGDAHAGRTETSLLLHLDPGLVRLGRAEAGATEPVRELLPRLRAHGVRAISPNGVLGDPEGASAEEGAALFAHAVAEGAARAIAWRPDARTGMLGAAR